MDPTLIKDIGVVGGIALGLFLLVKQVVGWMQGRVDAKDSQIADMSAKHLELATAVIQTAEKASVAIDALTTEIKGMGEAICRRLDGIEGQQQGQRRTG
jgi:hypothetical protein